MRPTHKKAVTTEESVSGDGSLRILPSRSSSPCNHVTWEGVDGANLDPDATYRFSADIKLTDGMTQAPSSDTYDVQVATDAGFTNVIQNETSVQVDSVEAGSLAKGTTYHWRVRAENAAGTGPWAVSAFTTSDRAPRRYYVKDHLGSIRAVVDPDASGSETDKVVETRDYYPFGLRMPGRSVTPGTETQEDYTGHELDVETGMHYAGARYYMGALGRWTSTDPILREQSPRKLLKDGNLQAFSMSAYNYSFNNPTNFRDPDGRFACGGICIVAGAALAGAAIGAGVEAAKQWYEGDGYDGRKIAVSGAKSSLIGVGGLLGPLGAAAGGGVAEVAEGVLKGESASDYVVDAAGGSAGALLGGLSGKTLGQVASSTGVVQKLAGTVQRLGGSKQVKQLLSQLGKTEQGRKLIQSLGVVGKQFQKTLGEGTAGQPGAQLSGLSVEGIGAAVLFTIQNPGELDYEEATRQSDKDDEQP